MNGAEVKAICADRMLTGGRITAGLIEIEDGRIASVLTSPSEIADALRRLPESGLLTAGESVVVLPGNVDTHVHINEPGRTSWEGFASGTEAAARGGVTALVDMPLNSIPPTIDVAALRAKQAAAAGKLRVDTGFWGGLVPDNLGRLEELWEAGVYGFKCFLLPSGVDEFPPVDRRDFLAGMKEAGRFGGLVIVHAEDAETIAGAPQAGGRRYADFLESRPEKAELRAIRQVVEACRETGTRTHLLHLSSARALDIIQAAKAEGLPLTVETCPHYLCFDASTIPDAAPEFKCCPPIRDEGNRTALWQGLAEGLIDCVVSDHSPATLEEKRRGGGDLQQAWGGVSGLQVGFAAVAAEARHRGFGLERVSDWMAARPAGVAGVHGKGRIEPGLDADVVFYDESLTVAVKAAELAHRNPVSAYDGLSLQGGVLRTVLRGRTVYDGGSAVGGSIDGGSAGNGTLNDRPAAPSGRMLSRLGDRDSAFQTCNAVETNVS